jgi:carbon monoxide dehydrogenase subunit G
VQEGGTREAPLARGCPDPTIPAAMNLRIEKTVAADPKTVFAAASDFANAPKRITGITRVEMLTQGPVGVGTRFRETRRMFGKEATETMEVTAFEPGRSYVLACDSHGCRYRSEIRVEPAAGGSKLTMTFEAEPLTRMAKVLSFLMKPMVKSVAKHVARDLDDLKAAVEAGR